MNKFPIAYWYGIRPEFLTRERVEEAAQCGFTLIECSYDTETNLKVLQWCEELGIKAIVYDHALGLALAQAEGWEDALRKMMDTYRSCPALHWYHLRDEPVDDLFPLLAKIVSFMKDYDPDHPAYINLLPNVALGNNDNYRRHVRNFLDTVRPAMLSYDHYSFKKREVEQLGDLPEARVSAECRERNNTQDVIYEEFNEPFFFDNLEICRRFSQEYGLPLMNIILLSEHWHYRLLGEAELRWEAYNSMAYGVSYLSYFTYWTPGLSHGEPWSYHHGIINADGSRDIHYDMVQKINRELAVIGPVLTAKRSTAVFHVGSEEDSVTPFAPFAGIEDIAADSLTVGFFDEDTMVIVNKNFYTAQTVSLKSARPLTILDKETLTPRALTAENGVYTLTLAAGDGEMITIG